VKKLLAFVLGSAMVLSLAACGGGNTSTSEPSKSSTSSAASSNASSDSEFKWDTYEGITITYGHANATSETNNIMVENWMNAVKEASQGKIKFDYYPGGQLGTYVEIIEQIDTGALNMSISDMSLFEPYTPEFGILYSPFIIDSYDHAQAVAYGDAIEMLQEYLAEDTNTYWLGTIMNGKRIVSTNLPINSVDDCQGVVIRVPEAQVYSDTFSLLGMSPTPMSLTDTYTAIQTNVVNGFECPAQAIYNGGYHKIAPYIWKSGHMYSFQGWTANQAFWDGLPQEVRDMMVKCWEDLQGDYNAMLIGEEDEIYQKMEAEGCTVVEFKDRQQLIDRCSGYWSEKAESIGSRAQEFLKAINAAR